MWEHLRQKTNRGNTYRVLWRAHGRQRSLTFENLPSAERFKTLLEDHGSDKALRVIELDEIGKHVPTVTEWPHPHRQHHRRAAGHDQPLPHLRPA